MKIGTNTVNKQARRRASLDLCLSNYAYTMYLDQGEADNSTII